MAKPPFIEQDGDGQIPPPYDFKGVGIRSFPLAADLAKLVGVCDRFLNIGQQGFAYRPLAPLVYLQVLTYRYMASRAPGFAQMGYMTQNELYFAIPVVKLSVHAGALPVPLGVGLFVPYIYVDNSWSMACGRDVIGYPKMYGWFEIPEDVRFPYPMRMETMVFETYDPSSKLSRELLVEIGSRYPSPQTPDEDYEASRLWPFGPINLLFGADAQFPLDDAHYDLVDQRATEGLYSAVQLKQFRDAEDSKKACYQAIVSSSVSLDKLSGAGLLPYAAVELHAYASLPIAEVLGLVVVDGMIYPLFPFWAECDFSFDDTTNLYERC